MFVGPLKKESKVSKSARFKPPKNALLSYPVKFHKPRCKFLTFASF